MKKKEWRLIVGVLVVVASIIGVSYAAWVLEFKQATPSNIASSCFSVTFTEDTDSISLTDAYPMVDADGKRLTPYTFTITNKCEAYASYQVNLEVLNSSTLTNHGFLKVMLDSKTTSLLSSNEVVSTTLSNATTSYKLGTYYLDSKQSKTHNLRIWLDENVEMGDGVNNQTFDSMITISATYSPTIPSDYELCLDEYGENAVQCNIVASSTENVNACPLSNDSGEVFPSEYGSSGNMVCEAQDDYGTSYYFRGNVVNNWVKFGGHYWRIIRINGDGSVRMIYAGDASVIDALDESTKATVLKNGRDDSATLYTQIGTSKYNYYWKKDNVEDTTKYVYGDNAGVGYMYGNLEKGKSYTTSITQAQTNTNDSTIKEYIDSWYKNNLINYESYISDSLFCNDRSFPKAIPSRYSNLGYYNHLTVYRSYSGFSEGRTLLCKQQNDQFTVTDDIIGNANLTYPVGLITADEAILAGGGGISGKNYYLYTGYYYWGMTPHNYNEATNIFTLSQDGNAYAAKPAYADLGVRPVINLKPGVLNSGTGVWNDPYKIV